VRGLPLRQRAICERYDAVFDPPPESRAGVALHTMGQLPLNGLRHRPKAEVSGWYLWGGEDLRENDDFFQPICVRHLDELCPAALDFLALPPGWRFQTDGLGYVDVWFDGALLEV
jgi:hypothetical protein